MSGVTSGIVGLFTVGNQVMSWDIFLLADFIVFYSNVVDVHVFWLTFFRVNGLDFLQKVDVSLVILLKAVINITSYPMPVSSISGVVIIFVPFLIFIDIIQRSIWRFQPFVMLSDLFLGTPTWFFYRIF